MEGIALCYPLFRIRSMMKKILFLFSLLGVTSLSCRASAKEYFPDGQEITEWFYEVKPVKLEDLGKQYLLTDHGIFADGRLHTHEIQALIDTAAERGGGVIVVPAGVYLTGGLYFRPGTHLHLREGAVLQGSDFIGDYRLDTTRIEGETCLYFGALINADGVDGFTISGQGTIDGNGLRYHQAFWLRRQWNRKCLNKDEQRPRLLYVANSNDVQIEGVRLQNSPYWTTHFCRCNRIKLVGLKIYSLDKPDDSKGPSTDAIDLDVVKDVLIRDCYMSVNDDAVSMKGGKGPWADNPEKSVGNGMNENVLIENCTYGFCHSCLTMGSESVHNRNIVMRNIHVTDAFNLLWLKMRPDTPQLYEYITVERCEGDVHNFIYLRPWTQFYDLKDRPDVPMSYADHIRMTDCKIQCNQFFNVTPQPDQYKLSNFIFRDLEITALKDASFNTSLVEHFEHSNVNIK